MVSRALAAAVGLVVDRAAGEPPALVHPVALFGSTMQRVEQVVWRDSRAAGSVHALVGVGLAAVAAGVVRSTAVATYVAAAGRSLATAATEVGAALEQGDLETARRLLPSLVGREPSGLDEREVARAVVESVAENTVDAVVATGFWAALAGPRGALVHRAANTMDAMVGHRSARHGRYGTAAARLDDVAAWVPARLTAALVAAVRPRRARDIWRAVRCDAPAHPSPNSGVAEAAFAAALGLRLGGPSRYGDRVEHRPLLGSGCAPDAPDIAAAVRLSRDVTAALVSLLVAADAAARLRPRRR